MGIVWLFVRGVALEPATVVVEFLTRLAIGLLLTVTFRRFYADEVSPSRVVRVGPYTVLCLLIFLKDLPTANVDVAYGVFVPSIPIEPDVVEVPLLDKSDLAITTIADSITLTPRTLTMDYDESRNMTALTAIRPEKMRRAVCGQQIPRLRQAWGSSRSRDPERTERERPSRIVSAIPPRS